MLLEIIGLIGGVWDLIRSGWNWVVQLVREIRADLARLLWPESEAAPTDEPTPEPAVAVSKKESANDSGMSQPAVSAPRVPAPAEVVQPAPSATAERVSADDKGDENALARMLASDESPREVKLVRGWIAVQQQRSRRVSMFKFLTRGLGYGPRNRKAQGQPSVYASTSERPSDMDRAVAQGLLTDSVVPSAAIRAHKPGQIVERGKGLTDEQILRRQTEAGQGIFGRLQDTNWLLLSPDAPALNARTGQSASEVLDSLPSVPVMDAARSMKTAA